MRICNSGSHDCNTIVIVNLISIGDISKSLRKALKDVLSRISRKN